jgi:hypothetical protein
VVKLSVPAAEAEALNPPALFFKDEGIIGKVMIALS